MPMLFSTGDILKGVDLIAEKIISKDTMLPEVVIPIMSGAFLFTSDLLRAMFPTVDPIVNCIKLNRVPRPTDNSKFTVIDSRWTHTASLHNKRVLIIDTIFDSGATAEKAKSLVMDRQARSVEVACLLWRNDPVATHKPEYHAFDLRNSRMFVYGYGLDLSGKKRGFNEIWYV